MATNKIAYRVYRDDNNKLSAPEKVAMLVKQYFAKRGKMPTVIGVPPSFPEDAVISLRNQFDVRFDVPAWAVNEIWLGVVDESSSSDMSHGDFE